MRSTARQHHALHALLAVWACTLAAAQTAAQTAAAEPVWSASGPGIFGSAIEPQWFAQVITSPDSGAGIAWPAGRANGRDEAYPAPPDTRRGYLGLNVGRSGLRTGCGTGASGCGDGPLSVYVYTGGMFTTWLGGEVGYFNSGMAERAGGQSRVQAIQLSLLARVPLGPFNAFVKGGTHYGQTRVFSGLLSGVDAGRRSGWGASYGAGMGFDCTPSSAVVLEWSRHGFGFPGSGGLQYVDNTSLGYVHRF